MICDITPCYNMNLMFLSQFKFFAVMWDIRLFDLLEYGNLLDWRGVLSLKFVCETWCLIAGNNFLLRDFKLLSLHFHNIKKNHYLYLPRKFGLLLFILFQEFTTLIDIYLDLRWPIRTWRVKLTLKVSGSYNCGRRSNVKRFNCSISWLTR